MIIVLIKRDKIKKKSFISIIKNIGYEVIDC